MIKLYNIIYFILGDNGADFYLAYRGNINYFEFLWKVPFKELGDFYRTKM